MMKSKQTKGAYQQFLISFVRISYMHQVKLFKSVPLLCISLLFPAALVAQGTDLAALYPRADETLSLLVFEQEGAEFRMGDAFRARSADLAKNHPHLTVAGDFTGDGVDEIAFFDALSYTPNLNPEFTKSLVWISRSQWGGFIPAGSWFSVLDTGLSFNYVNFTAAADFNMDGYCDIAMFYNDPSSDQLAIYLLESDGSKFSEARAWYSCDRNTFNFTALKFACPGDFNGNGLPDIAVFYNYFGTAPETKQSIFLFESDGENFALLPVAFEATKAACDFSGMKFAVAGDFNSDSYSDVAAWINDPSGLQTQATVFEGSASGQLFPVVYYSAPVSELDLNAMVHAASGDFSGDEAFDLAVLYDGGSGGSQEILVLESQLTSMASPESAFVTDHISLEMSSITSLVAGNFTHQPMVSAALWKGEKQGAISFTFDDGYQGAFENGGAELEAAGLLGTFYIFTDTTLVYDGEIAPTSLVREYKERGHEIGSHSSNHSDLGSLSGTGDYDSLSRVLSESVLLLNERFDQTTLSMSIPFGSFLPGTLDSISNYFLSARSSQFGFNLATPYDFYALKSWPILSTTSPAFVNDLVTLAETYGYYLPLMYHNMLDEPFDEEAEIYTYGRDQFRETLLLAGQRNVWIAPHRSIYKYIRMRNALKISQVDMGEADLEPGHFSFVADDGLPDSVYNEELTLLIRLPLSWTADSATVEAGDQYAVKEVLSHNQGAYIRYNGIPAPNRMIHVFEGRKAPTSLDGPKASLPRVTLSAYPNPFSHETRIVPSAPAGISGKLVLMDVQGRRIREIQLTQAESFTLLREDLPAGLYFLQLVEFQTRIPPLKLIIR
jgi:peptidoglycan/xylan/chitin deacetylase (PgdA/CDA1 family)